MRLRAPHKPPRVEHVRFRAPSGRNADGCPFSDFDPKQTSNLVELCSLSAACLTRGKLCPPSVESALVLIQRLGFRESERKAYWSSRSVGITIDQQDFRILRKHRLRHRGSQAVVVGQRTADEHLRGRARHCRAPLGGRLIRRRRLQSDRHGRGADRHFHAATSRSVRARSRGARSESAGAGSRPRDCRAEYEHAHGAHTLAGASGHTSTGAENNPGRGGDAHARLAFRRGGSSALR